MGERGKKNPSDVRALRFTRFHSFVLLCKTYDVREMLAMKQ
jgi:ribosomal protein L30/L7E